MGNDPNSRQKSQMRRINSTQNIQIERDLNSSQSSQRTNISQKNSINKTNSQLLKTKPSNIKRNISNNNIKNSNINNTNFNKSSSNDNIHYNYNSNNSFSSDNNNHNSNSNSNNNNSNYANKKIYNYTFIKDLGKGTTGKVSLYRSNLNKQLVAIKEIDISALPDKTKKELNKEPQILQMIFNPYIIHFYEFFEEDNKLYICMEYCENNNLNSYINNYINKNQQIPESFIWKVAYQVLNALKYLHIEKKIVHKDIKPENLFLDKNEDIKLGDFSSSGIMPIFSKIATTIRMTNRKNYGTTPIFKCPEKSITFKSDIWSLGVTLYYMAQLKYPFEGNDEDEIKNNILNKVQDDLDQQYSASLNKIIKVMLTKDPLKRPSAYECMNLLPRDIREKYERPQNNSFENFLFQMFMASMGLGEMPPELKEEFNDLYLIVSEFPNLMDRNFLCDKCQKIPLIKINYNQLEVSSQCEMGHFQILNIKDFYRIFSDQRNDIKSNICTKCNRENEFAKKGVNYIFCTDCQQVLCTKCEEKHNEENPEHNTSDNLINFKSQCKIHKEKLSYFCQDCFINLCESCLVEHENKNIGHDIKKNELIDEKIIINPFHLTLLFDKFLII